MAEENKGNMTVSEAGRLGGNKVKEKYGPDFFSKIGEIGGHESWTVEGSNAKVPVVTEEEKQRAKEIRSKLEKGEDVTIDEVAFLGGLERVMQVRQRAGKK